MKKLVSLTLALTLILALSTTAFAFVAQNPANSSSSPFPTAKAPAPSSSTVTLKGQHGTVTLSEVSKTQKTTLKIGIESKSVTVYYVPSSCVLTNSGAADIVVYKKTNGYYSADSYIFESSVTLSPTFDLIEVAFGGGDNYYIMKSNSGSGSSSTKTSTTQKPATPSTPASGKTVTVAGQERIPGQIQNYNSGGYIYTVKSGDTLYDLAKRFYGNGGLWKELQKANQENLNTTRDGIIFVGFNLIVPAELGGVHADIG